ncbi:hypothetical protein [Flagellimonas sp.]|uniref:hypothetical protein n=1 Tax=Flagellimonas sp. TaxID=2058762 RepID=UPI0034B2FC3F
MKTLIVLFVAMTAFFQGEVSQELSLEATYLGFEEGIYTFVDEYGEEHEFSDIDAKVSKKYDLDSGDFVGRKFKVTYEIDTEIDENDEEYDVNYIVGLVLID